MPQRRFENVRVEYDIQDKRFNVPPLTLQPLVENAIRHGVRIREEGMCGGTLKLESREGEGTTVTIVIPTQDDEVNL